MSKSYGITPAYLAWKRAGSPGNVFCTACDCRAEPGHVHKVNQAAQVAIGVDGRRPGKRNEATPTGGIDPASIKGLLPAQQTDEAAAANSRQDPYTVTPEMRTWAQERVRKLKVSGALQIREDEKCEHKKYWLNCDLCQRTPKYMQ